MLQIKQNTYGSVGTLTFQVKDRQGFSKSGAVTLTVLTKYLSSRQAVSLKGSWNNHKRLKIKCSIFWSKLCQDTGHVKSNKNGIWVSMTADNFSSSFWTLPLQEFDLHYSFNVTYDEVQLFPFWKKSLEMQNSSFKSYLLSPNLSFWKNA